ncbi:MAG TPA: MDR family MFS transporter [Pseudonocardia sp.]|jgi:EmrB/QacA subfamily drug resistance transporter
MEGMPLPAPTGQPPSAADGPWLIPLLVLVAGMFMSLLDTTIVNVAIPRMQQDFGVTTTDIQWVSTAYTLALGVVVPLSGWLGDRFGLARIYRWSMISFAVTSALCGVAWNLGSMIAFRIMQAAPGGILPVAAMAMVYRIVPRQKMGAAMGVYGIGVSFAPAIGPTLGGYLVEYVDWRLIFYINVPFGALGAAAASFLLPKMAPTARDQFDWWGFATIATGLFALLLAFSKAEDWHWSSYRIQLLLVGGVLCLALFVVIELELDKPLIELRVLRSWPFVNSLLLVSVLMIGLQTILFYLPLFLQNSQRYEALPTGLLMLPESLVMAVLMPVAGLLYDRIGPRWPAAIGLAVAGYGTYLLCGITADMTQQHVVLWTCVRAVGNGLALMPIMTAGMAAIPAAHTSSGTTLNNLAQRISGSLGLAAMTVVADNRQSQLMADRSAMLPAQSALPQVHHAIGQGTSGLYGLYQQLLVEVTAGAYSDVFFATALVTGLGVVLGLVLRTQKPAPPPTAEPITPHRAKPPRAAPPAGHAQPVAAAS